MAPTGGVILSDRMGAEGSIRRYCAGGMDKSIPYDYKRKKGIKKAPRWGGENKKSEMTLDYCFQCHGKKHFVVIKGHFCSLLVSNIIG